MFDSEFGVGVGHKRVPLFCQRLNAEQPGRFAYSERKVRT
jgi:hypothetical protein